MSISKIKNIAKNFCFFLICDIICSMKKFNTFSYYLKNVVVAILIVLIFCCGFLTIANLTFYKTHIRERVKGFSMLPTLNSNVENSSTSGDTVYVNPYAKIQLNDIVVAAPVWHDNLIIKRLVGLPGDKIQIKDLGESYGLFVNDSLLYSKSKYSENGNVDMYGTLSYYKKYLSFLRNPSFANYVETENEESFIKLDKDEYFLMGDNWGNTLDSLSEGPVSRKEIEGKVNLIVDYKNKDRFVVEKHVLKQIFSFN